MDIQGWHSFYFDSVESTMDVSRKIITNQHQKKFICLAKEQTKGKGKYQKNWISELGNFYATLVLPLYSSQNVQLYTYLSCLAIRRAIVGLAKNKPDLIKNTKLKWANDILLYDKKVSGILLELENINNNYYLLIGMGINLINSPLNINATNLYEQLNMKITTEQMKTSILENFTTLDKIFIKYGFKKIQQEWLEHTCHHQKTICLQVNEASKEKKYTGKFLGINEQGKLQLLLQNNKIKLFCTGEIFNI